MQGIVVVADASPFMIGHDKAVTSAAPDTCPRCHNVVVTVSPIDCGVVSVKFNGVIVGAPINCGIGDGWSLFTLTGCLLLYQVVSGPCIEGQFFDTIDERKFVIPFGTRDSATFGQSFV